MSHLLANDRHCRQLGLDAPAHYDSITQRLDRLEALDQMGALDQVAHYEQQERMADFWAKRNEPSVEEMDHWNDDDEARFESRRMDD